MPDRRFAYSPSREFKPEVEKAFQPFCDFVAPQIRSHKRFMAVVNGMGWLMQDFGGTFEDDFAGAMARIEEELREDAYHLKMFRNSYKWYRRYLRSKGEGDDGELDTTIQAFLAYLNTKVAVSSAAAYASNMKAVLKRQAVTIDEAGHATLTNVGALSMSSQKLVVTTLKHWNAWVDSLPTSAPSEGEDTGADGGRGNGF